MTKTPAPRVRRRLSEATRREQLVQATIAVVAERGYDGASLALVAERAGVAKGLIWRYFDNRDDLMATTVRTTVAGIRESIAAELDLTAPVPDIIRDAVHRAAALHHTHREELAALRQIINNLRGPDGLPRLTASDYEETYAAQETLFRRGQEAGDLRPFDTRVMAVTYQSAIDAMLDYLHTHPDVEADDYADTLADLLLAGMRS